MIVDLPDTTVSAISRELVSIREDGGAVALGRVLTLIIATNGGHAEDAIEAANGASREHPMRVILLATEPGDDEARLDAEIRVGGDAGASEVVVLHPHGDVAADQESLVTGLLLPDAPVVVWWPGSAPDDVAASDLGRIATRRITDASSAADVSDALTARAAHYSPGDTDFAWTRLTLWRAQLAAVLDQPPYEEIESVEVAGAADSPSTILLGAWLRLKLGVSGPCDLREGGRPGIHRVTIRRPSGPVVLDRDQPSLATLTQPGQPVHDVTLPRRGLRDCLTEELRHLDPDELYGEVITAGLDRMSGVRP